MCSIPNRDKYLYGVASPISTDTDLDQLKEIINVTNNTNIVKIERLNSHKNKETVPSESIKITFSSSHMPDQIKIGFFNYRIRLYVFNPTQCYNCQ
jgi:hypothetical protein